MDYTGFGKDGKHNYKRDYKINRSLTNEERQRQLSKLDRASAEPQDWLSVIKINSTYLELVDRWYTIKGAAAWEGGLILSAGLTSFIAFFRLAIEKNEASMWMFFLFVGAVSCFFVRVGYRGMRFDICRMTHYPIRINRQSRRVY